eukprot:3392036-Rhodomonas_salina.1
MPTTASLVHTTVQNGDFSSRERLSKIKILVHTLASSPSGLRSLTPRGRYSSSTGARARAVRGRSITVLRVIIACAVRVITLRGYERGHAGVGQTHASSQRRRTPAPLRRT